MDRDGYQGRREGELEHQLRCQCVEEQDRETVIERQEKRVLNRTERGRGWWVIESSPFIPNHNEEEKKPNFVELPVILQRP